MTADLPLATTENERSWGIEIIREGSILMRGGRYPGLYNLSGERGLRAQELGWTVLFPDVYVQDDAGRVVMGWELKFPDTAIDDRALFENAVEKARRLKTTSFLLWNVNVAVLWTRDEPLEENDPAPFDGWAASWTQSLPVTLERGQVDEHRHDWQRLLGDVLETIVEYLDTGRIQPSRRRIGVDRHTYAAALHEAGSAQAELLHESMARRPRFRAQVRRWAQETGSYDMDGGTGEATLVMDLARLQIVHWLNRLALVHELRGRGFGADEFLDRIDAAAPGEVSQVMAEFGEHSGLGARFAPVTGEDLLSAPLYAILIGIHQELTALGEDGRPDFTDSLQHGLQHVRSKAAGQFATPPLLARLLVALTVEDMHGTVVDPCCGTGTIVRAALDAKFTAARTPELAAEEVWASDRFAMPLAFAGMALTDHRTLDHPQRVHRRDVALLAPGQTVSLREPHTGAQLDVEVPAFDAVVSNLPFVRFEKLADESDMAAMDSYAGERHGLSGRSDLYAYILLGLHRLVKKTGRIGVIVSNSWLHTSWGAGFRQALLERFDLEMLLTSGDGRWFSNAEVATSLLVLRPRDVNTTDRTFVGFTRRHVDDWTDATVDALANNVFDALETGRSQATDEVTGACLTRAQLRRLDELGIPWTMGATGVTDLDRLAEVTLPFDECGQMNRGCRPGWERFWFVPRHGDARIEREHLLPLIHRPAESLTPFPLAAPRITHDYFHCESTEAELEASGHTGALTHIRAFANVRTGQGRLGDLPAGRGGWYTRARPEEPGLMLLMNPDKVLAVYRTTEPEAVFSQRIISFTPREEDLELVHALASSTVSLLWHELTAVGQGLGSLNRNRGSAGRHIRIPRVELLDDAARTAIKEAFVPVRDRVAVGFDEELVREDRRALDRAVLDGLGLENLALEDLHRLVLQPFTVRQSYSATRRRASSATAL